MAWYYSNDDNRLGPIEDEQWQQLIASGEIKDDTLVWKTGMADWVPYSSLAPSAAPATGPACAECGTPLPAEDLVNIGGSTVCGACKPIVLQRMKEGAAGVGMAEDPETLIQEVRARDYNIRARSCIARGFAVVKNRFWLSFGTTFLCYLVIIAASMIPCGGLVFQGPILGGIFWFFLKLIRQGDARVGDGFEGINRDFVQLMLCGVMPLLIVLLCMIPFAIIGGVAGAPLIKAMNDESVGTAVVFAIVGVFYLLMIAALLVMATVWLFSLPLIIDRRFKFWPAMEVSRKVVMMHFFQVFKLLLLMGLIGFAVSMLFFVIPGIALGVFSAAGVKEGTLGAGFFVLYLLMFLVSMTMMPVFFCAIAHAYEDVFSGKRPALT